MTLSVEFYYYILLVVILIILIFFFFRTFKMLKKKKIWASCRNSSYFLLMLFFLVSLSLIGSNIFTYHRLTYEKPIATLDITRHKHQNYQIELLQLEACRKTSYTLNGDEWQIDARIIKWHGWANLLGLDASFQLDRISGRYQNIEQQRNNKPTTFSIKQKQDFDLWTLKKKHQWLPGLDARYGQSVFLAMKDKQMYQLYMTQTGLIARKITSEPHEECHF